MYKVVCIDPKKPNQTFLEEEFDSIEEMDKYLIKEIELDAAYNRTHYDYQVFQKTDWQRIKHSVQVTRTFYAEDAAD